MQSLRKLFSYMNDIDFSYIVLRNWENLPDDMREGEHGDLDLLVYDLDHFREIFPDVIPVNPLPRVRHKIVIEGIKHYMDVRYVGDGYYPTNFQLNMLETRELNDNGFYTPNPVHHRIGLAYHAVHHKNVNKYKKYLGDVSIDQLLDSLKKSNIGYVTPKDPTVGTFNQYWKGATSVVTKEDGKILKKQNNFGEFDLIKNEHRILSQVDSRHFPKCSLHEDAIEIEDCGERLTVYNLPEDWKDQLKDILGDLKKNNIQHRDIKPDNLMVKDGIVKLIDFGWARFNDDPEDSPPQCLGFPYKPTWGWDDNFSVKKIIKELEYQKEEICELSG